MAPGRLRRPDPAHKNKNGFREFDSPIVDKDRPDDITLRHVRLAQYILANKGTYVPSYVLASSSAPTDLQPHPGPRHCESLASPSHAQLILSMALLRKSKSSKNSTQRTSRTYLGSNCRNIVRGSSIIGFAMTSRRTWTLTKHTLTKWSSRKHSRWHTVAWFLWFR